MRISIVSTEAAALAAQVRPSASDLAHRAVTALIDEATLTPKPGLVDFRSRGAHRDMGWMLMCHSAWALHRSFCAMAEAGARGFHTRLLREQIGRIGREAEATMMQATGGINTHRGAIWTLGLLVTAAAEDTTPLNAAAVAFRAGEIARHEDRFAPEFTGNKGAAACREFGVGGARGQAKAGFPHAVDIALPCLRASRRRGDDENTARLNALLSVMAELDDTCVLSRGGRGALASLQSGAARVLAAGGAGSCRGKDALRSLEADALLRNVSPGGAADLLAAMLFLDRLMPDA